MIGQFHLDGKFLKLVADTDDVGDSLDLTGLAGLTLTFRSNIPVEQGIPDLETGALVYVSPRTAIVQSDGTFKELIPEEPLLSGMLPRTSLAEDTGIDLMAASDLFDNPVQWTISSATSVRIGNRVISPISITFNAPEAGWSGTLDEVTPIGPIGATLITRGFRGYTTQWRVVDDGPPILWQQYVEETNTWVGDSTTNPFGVSAIGEAILAADTKDEARAATDSDVGVKPQNAVLFGDSIVALGQAVSGTVTYYDQRSWWGWANAFLGWRFNFLNNAGVSGDTLVQMLARINTDVLAYNPSWVWMDGGVNDINAGATYAQVVSRFQAIFAALAARNIRVVCLTVTPSIAFNSTQNTIRGQVNNWLRDYGASNPNVIVVDQGPIIQDPASAVPYTGYSVDGLHPSTLGGMAIGMEVARVLEKITVPRSPLTTGSDLTNILGSNAAMAGVAGTVTGLATGWKVSETGSASAYSKVASNDGILQEWQRVITPAGNNSSAIYLSTDPTTGFTAGDTIFGAVELRVSNADLVPTADQQRVMLQLTCFDASLVSLGASVFAYGYYAPGYSQTLPFNYTATLRTPNIVVPASTAKIRLILWGFGGATRDWRRPIVRKV